MTDYLAILKSRTSKTPNATPPRTQTKPTGCACEGFEGARGRGVLNLNSAAPRRSVRTKDPFEGFEGSRGRRVLKNEGLRFRPGVPAEWVEGFGSLSREKPLPGFSATRWNLLLDDGLAFLNQWAAKAAALGWGAGDLFGIHPAAPAARFDQMGLVLVIAGGRVIGVLQDRAGLRSPGGSVLTYYRGCNQKYAYLWHPQNPQKGASA